MSAESTLRALKARYPRAYKLMDNREEFLVVKVDEPYAVNVMAMIRECESAKGSWTKDDEEWAHRNVPGWDVHHNILEDQTALQKRIHNLENENAILERKNRRLDREIECDACFHAKVATPEGARQHTCFITEEGEIIVLGNPEDEDHNCDAMGCSSVSHVIFRQHKEKK